MHPTAWFGGLGFGLLLLGGVGCVSNSGKANRITEPANSGVVTAPAAGHWVTLPPETGSRIPRRMWMNEDGTLSARPGAARIESYDGTIMQQWQQRGAFHGRSGD